jgi:dihydroorotase
VRPACTRLTLGVKSYPRGVTTNSSAGIEDYGVYYPVFKAMEEEGMVLNLHGEIPSDPEKVGRRHERADDQNISVLNAEKLFLTHLRKLSADFPNLRIVLEHATTAEAVECVRAYTTKLTTGHFAPRKCCLHDNSPPPLLDHRQCCWTAVPFL